MGSRVRPCVGDHASNYDHDHDQDYQSSSRSNEKASGKRPKNTKHKGEPPSGYTLPFYSTQPPHWGCSSAPHPEQSGRKHARDEQASETARVAIAKSLEFDDPIEAANSSIWTTIRTKNRDRVSKGGFFRGAHHYNGNNNERSNSSDEVSSMVLELNPAALSRSLAFHEIAR